MQDRSPPSRRNPLATHGRLPKWGVRATSAFPPVATELRTSLVVRFVPFSELAFHSITSSAIIRKLRLMVKPSTLAVLRFITSSNLVGC